jgi:DNA topoisomerase-1
MSSGQNMVLRSKKRVGKKWVYAKLGKLDPQKITLKEALQLLEYPKVLGQFEGKDILLKKGGYGFYLNYQGENYSLENEKITLQEAIQKIREARKRIIKQLAPNILVLQGPYGPYVQVKRRKVRKNYGLPQNVKPENLTLEDLEKILKQRPRRFSRKRTNGPDVE